MPSAQLPIAVMKLGTSPSRFCKGYSCIHTRSEVRAFINDAQRPHLGQVLKHRVEQLYDSREESAINPFPLKG